MYEGDFIKSIAKIILRIGNQRETMESVLKTLYAIPLCILTFIQEQKEKLMYRGQRQNDLIVRPQISRK